MYSVVIQLGSCKCSNIYNQYAIKISVTVLQISAPVSTGNTFQDLPQLRETADNTERYI
jgi:hypothetical protein